MTCSKSLLYSYSCRFLNSSNSLSVFSVFLFSSSTSSTRVALLSCSAASYSRSFISADVSALVELVQILAFFKKDCCRFPRMGPCPRRRRGPCKQHQHQSLVATHQQHVLLAQFPFEMSTGNSPSGVTAPSSSPWGQISPVPIPVKAHREHFFPIPVPARGFNPCGDPHPRKAINCTQKRPGSSMHMC